MSLYKSLNAFRYRLHGMQPPSEIGGGKDGAALKSDSASAASHGSQTRTTKRAKSRRSTSAHLKSAERMKRRPFLRPGTRRRLLRGVALSIGLGGLFAPVYWFASSGQAVRTANSIVEGVERTLVGIGLRPEVLEVRRKPAAIDGNRSLTLSTAQRDEVITALAVDLNRTIVVYDLNASRKRVESLPWVKRAHVTRLLPDTVRVSVEPRIAIASWVSHSGQKLLLDEHGEEYQEHKTSLSEALINVSGDGAREEVADLYKYISQTDYLRGSVRQAHRIDSRRWNLVLDSGTIIKLPPHAVASSLQDLELLIANDNLLYYPLSVIDYRQTDRVVLRFKNRRLGEDFFPLDNQDTGEVVAGFRSPSQPQGILTGSIR